MNKFSIENVFKIVVIFLLVVVMFQSCNTKGNINNTQKKVDELVLIINKQYQQIDTLNKRVEFLSKDLQTQIFQQFLTKTALTNKDVTINQLKREIEKKVK